VYVPTEAAPHFSEVRPKKLFMGLALYPIGYAWVSIVVYITFVLAQL
jgi:hypothetical protein